MKAAELTNLQLDWAVAEVEGLKPFLIYPYDGNVYIEGGRCFVPRYSTVWEQGGPIIEREGINLTQFKEDEVDPIDVGAWCATYDRETFGDDEHSCTASTPLIAAMRCYVKSKLGDEITIPEELK